VTAYGNYNQITTYCYELQTNSQLLMTEHRKISRVLQLIARLRHPIGHRKTDLARRFGVNVRTIERYIILLKELGFNVLQDGNRFRIAFIDNKGFKQEEHIVFTLEEAMGIKEALLNSNAIGPLRNILLDKLYSLTDIDDLATTMSKLNHSNNITVINKAIKNKVQVVLKEYNSARSAACDRLVEPIRFYAYFQYLKAYELKAKRVKIFKTDRIGGAELTLAPWAFEERHEAVKREISRLISAAHNAGCKVGICGQAPSDYPDFAAFLVEEGIDSISLNPDSVIKVKKLVSETEAQK